MSDSVVVASYLELVAEDLRGAKALSQINNRNAILLCAQAAEKLVRAVLAAEDKHHRGTGPIPALVDEVSDENPMKPLLRGIERLGDYAPSFGYPTPDGLIQPSPGREELDIFASRIARALGDAAPHLAVDLLNPGASGSVEVRPDSRSGRQGRRLR